MFKEKSRVELTVNAKEASHLLELYNNYAGQRSVHHWKLKAYRNSIKGKTFRKSEVSLAHNLETGEVFLVNGQHRLLSVVGTKYTIDIVLVTIDCDTSADVLALWGTFDTQLARNINDIASAHALEYGVEWKPKVRSYVVSYSQYSEFRMFSTGRSDKNLSSRAAGMRKHIKAGDFLNLMSGLFMTVKDNRAFNNVGVASCIMHCFECYGEDVAIEFWEAVLSLSDVVNGVPLELNDPRRTLRRTYINAHSDRENGWWATNFPCRFRIAILYQGALMHFLKGTKVSRIMFKKEATFDWEPSNKWSKKVTV